MLKSLLAIQPNIRLWLGKSLLLCFVLFSHSSCTDQGCIEADDFGEYEQQTLTIPANALSESCDYFPDKPLTDAMQGSNLRSCFTQGNPEVIDENGNPHSVDTNNGCLGFENLTIQRICVEDCHEKCINGASSSSGTAEPYWIATAKKKEGQNYGVTLTPGAEIYIRAIGNVILGGDISKPVYTYSRVSVLQSQSNTFSPSFFDVKQSITKNVKFSGRWTSGSAPIITYGGDITSTNPDEQARAFNGARRLAAFVIPHPTGYGFDVNNATSEINGIRGTPLFADDRLWYCSYTGADMNQSSCGTYSYNSNGFPNTDDAAAFSIYTIKSTSRSENLGDIGGAIRWTDDRLGEDLQPIGTYIGDLTNNIEKTPASSDYAVRVTLEDTSTGDICSAINLHYDIMSSRAEEGGSSGSKVFIVEDANIPNVSSFYVDLEPGDSIIFRSNTALDTSDNSNCGTKILFKTYKLHDIQINKSGFVGFTTMAPSGTAASCALNGRIINKQGSRVDNSCNISDPNDPGCFDNDFYEYDNFGTASSDDPLDGLTVNISPTSPSPFTKNWGNKFFVRKGQFIRLSPDSWNGTWSNGTITRKCGIGMVMKVGGFDYTTGTIDEKPAFLCRGTAIEQVPNPECVLAGTNPETCQKYSEKCTKLDSNGIPEYQSFFCPDPTCQVASPASTCNNSGATPPGNSPSVTEQQCIDCFNEMEDAGAQPVNLDLDVDQCYNLEDYKGKVSNIPSSTGFTNTQFETYPDTIIKGAEKLLPFNGSYGNFSNLINTDSTENGNIVYRLREPLYPSYDGRLMFVLVDNDSFGPNINTDYDDNGSVAGNYNGSNGFKIDLSGRQEFKNGDWLEATLCLETTNSSSVCSTISPPTQLYTEPHIVALNDPAVAGDSSSSKSYFKFDPYGSLVFTNAGSIGVPPSGLSQVTVGDNFYRHGYEGVDSSNGADNSDEKKASRVANLKISFKIKDTDIPNCDIDNPQLGQTSCSASNCGIVAENRFYNSSVSGNANKICESDESPGATPGTECQKQFFCANPYYNNSGQYDVVVKVKNKQSDLSNIVNSVVSPVVEIMDGTPDRSKIGQTEKMYIKVVSDVRFQAIVQIMVILMITFYGVGYLMGVSEFSQNEIVMRIVKIGIIYLFIGPNGWEWFNQFFVQLFKNGTDYVTFLMASAFDKSTELQNAIDNNSFYDKSILFGSIDKVFGLFFNSVVQKKISALLFASVFGPIYLFIIYLGFFSYVYAVAYAVLLYLTAQIFISILFIVGPIFFIMLLFNQTKEMFDKWIGELVGLSLQQIMLLLTLSFFSMLMYEIIKMALGYRICWDTVWTFPVGPIRIKLLSFWTVASMPPKLNLQTDVANVGNPEGIPSLFVILFIWVIGSLAHKFVEFMTNVASAIAGSIQATSLSSGLKGLAQNGYNAASGLFKAKIGNSVMGGVQEADRFLFDSGKKADDDRKKSKEALTKDRQDRSTLMKAGSEAVEKFKKENGDQLLGKTQVEQEKLLKGVRYDAMKQKGAELGYKGEEGEKALKALLEGRSQIMGADLASVAYNAFKDRKTWNSSLKDKNADTKMSGSQIKATSKKLDNDGKKQLNTELSTGEIRSSISRKEMMMDALGRGALFSAAKHGALSLVSPVTNRFEGISDKENWKKAPGKAWNAMTKESDYSKARSELEKDGTISTNFIKTEEERKAVANRVNEMRTEYQDSNLQSVKEGSAKSAFIDRATKTTTKNGDEENNS